MMEPPDVFMADTVEAAPAGTPITAPEAFRQENDTALRLWLITIKDAPLFCGFCGGRLIASETTTVQRLLDAVEEHGQTCTKGLTGIRKG